MFSLAWSLIFLWKRRLVSFCEYTSPDVTVKDLFSRDLDSRRLMNQNRFYGTVLLVGWILIQKIFYIQKVI